LEEVRERTYGLSNSLASRYSLRTYPLTLRHTGHTANLVGILLEEEDTGKLGASEHNSNSLMESCCSGHLESK
jgi:hypothetical protein